MQQSNPSIIANIESINIGVSGNVSIGVSINESDNKCSICLEQLNIKYKTRCGHVFHRHCITEWAKNNNTCPICRQNLSLFDYRNINKFVRFGLNMLIAVLCIIWSVAISLYITDRLVLALVINNLFLLMNLFLINMLFILTEQCINLTNIANYAFLLFKVQLFVSKLVCYIKFYSYNELFSMSPFLYLYYVLSLIIFLFTEYKMTSNTFTIGNIIFRRI